MAVGPRLPPALSLRLRGAAIHPLLGCCDEGAAKLCLLRGELLDIGLRANFAKLGERFSGLFIRIGFVLDHVNSPA